MTNKLTCQARNDSWILFITLLVFIFSIFLSKFYVAGDQLSYQNSYRLIEGLGLQDGFRMYERNISSAEYVHFFLSLVGTNLGIDKNLVMSLFNGMLAFFSLRLFEKWGADFRVAVLVVLTNFYMLVLYFAAERLKFGFLFLVLSLLYSSKPWAFYSLAFLSILSHFSMLLIWAAIWLAEFYSKLSMKVKFQRKNFLLLFLVLLPPLVLFLYESKNIFWKLGSYIEGNENLTVLSFLPVGVLIVMTGVYTKNIYKSLLIFAPFLVGIAIIGGSRLNMLAYLIFLGFGLTVKGGLNFGVLMTSAYFFYKSIEFVANILNHGYGFS